MVPVTAQQLRRGPGREAEAGVREEWTGRRAQAFTRLCIATYGSTCWLCGLPGVPLKMTADHVIPISKGGAVYDLANLAPAHGPCNFRRGNRPAELYSAVESGLSFFSGDLAATHAQPLPFLSDTSEKTEGEDE